MTNIRKIEATVVTSDRAGAQADGRVFLGLCGREFRCDSTEDDFERGVERVYRFGDGASVVHVSKNNPRRPQLQLEQVGEFPIYIRFDDRNDNQWKLKSVEVKLNDDEDQQYVNVHSEMWLGLHSGAYCYLKKR